VEITPVPICYLGWMHQAPKGTRAVNSRSCTIALRKRRGCGMDGARRDALDWRQK